MGCFFSCQTLRCGRCEGRFGGGGGLALSRVLSFTCQLIILPYLTLLILLKDVKKWESSCTSKGTLHNSRLCRAVRHLLDYLIQRDTKLRIGRLKKSIRKYKHLMRDSDGMVPLEMVEAKSINLFQSVIWPPSFSWSSWVFGYINCRSPRGGNSQIP